VVAFPDTALFAAEVEKTSAVLWWSAISP